MIRRCLAAWLVVALFAPLAGAGDWPQWRGPLGTGQSDEKDVPVTWSKTENVKWRVPLEGPGNSTPIVVKGKVIITAAADKGQRRGVICFDRADGKQLWKQEIAYAEPETTHNTNPYCSSSPVTDGERVIAWHGSAGMFCYDLDGKELWRKDLGKFDHVWGNASSPVIHQDRVFLNAGPGLSAFVAAFDKRTGEELWRQEYADIKSAKSTEFHGSWSTPVLYRDGARELLLLSLPKRLYAVDPQQGAEVWSCGGLTKLVYTSPVTAGNIVVAMSGYHGSALAVKAGGSGDVTDSHRLWLNEQRNPQRVGSGVVVGDHLYILQDSGQAWCLDVKTGERKWEQRLSGTWGSMVHADGRLYVLATSGTTYVLEPNPAECKVLAENALGETCRSSVAVSSGNIFLRTYNALYCVGP